MFRAWRGGTSTFSASVKSKFTLPCWDFCNNSTSLKGCIPSESIRLQSRGHTSGSHADAATSCGYAKLTPEIVSHLKHIVGSASVITGEDNCASYNVDWMRKYRGKSKLVLKPSSTHETSRVLAYCNQQRIAVVPQGGNTGLVGGSVPVYDEVVLSLERLNKVRSIDPQGAVVCEAGCILQNIDDQVRDHGLVLPLDLGAKGSCQIGGNVATNAGGLRLLRYGSLHGNVLGLEVVLADGTILNTIKTLRKDNTGYDLKQLFIGSEGTLGVITAVSLLCPPMPSSVQVTFLAAPSFAAVQGVLSKARAGLGEVLSACEFLDAASLSVVSEHVEGAKSPLGGSGHPFYMVVETSGSDARHDREKLEAFLEDCMAEGLVADGTIAESESAAQRIWHVRESISEACLHAGAQLFKYDLSFPVRDMYEIVEEMRQRLRGQATVLGYGHLGDGNLHLNIVAEADAQVSHIIEPFVYEFTQSKQGSISAEHGLGLMKGEKIGYSQPPEAIRLMATLKAMLDPNNILNPYKVLPREAVAQAHAEGRHTIS
uniref:D-2-hydroxyglutarate dehydrogenase n=1 Tax=Tetraselmis sp. GSL018 TaxID=582737 RepID=A0A061SMM5_9CHLO